MQKLKEHAMRTSQKTPETLTTIGIDLGKNTFHLLGWTSGAPSLCSGRYPVVNSNTAFPMSRAA
jgi:hypothetical protein